MKGTSRSALRCWTLSALLVPSFLSFGCGAGTSGGTITTSPSTGKVPQLGHVVVVVEENTSYPQVIGNSAMPYFNSLAKKYGLATQYFANVHPSSAIT